MMNAKIEEQPISEYTDRRKRVLTEQEQEVDEEEIIKELEATAREIKKYLVLCVIEIVFRVMTAYLLTVGWFEIFQIINPEIVYAWYDWLVFIVLQMIFIATLIPGDR